MIKCSPSLVPPLLSIINVVIKAVLCFISIFPFLRHSISIYSFCISWTCFIHFVASNYNRNCHSHCRLNSAAKPHYFHSIFIRCLCVFFCLYFECISKITNENSGFMLNIFPLKTQCTWMKHMKYIWTNHCRLHFSHCIPLSNLNCTKLRAKHHQTPPKREICKL